LKHSRTTLASSFSRVQNVLGVLMNNHEDWILRSVAGQKAMFYQIVNTQLWLNQKLH